jgi:hypothetical protein
MGSKTLSQEYDFSESQDSPLRTYKPIRQRNQQKCSDEKRRKISNKDTDASKNFEELNTENVPPDLSVPSQRRVVYMLSEELITQTDKMIKVPHRVILFIHKLKQGNTKPLTYLVVEVFLMLHKIQINTSL